MKPLEHLYRVAPGKARGRARCPPTSPTLRWPTSVLNSRPMLSDVHSRIRHGYITKMRNQAVIFNITMSLSRERANPFERRHPSQPIAPERFESHRRSIGRSHSIPVFHRPQPTTPMGLTSTDIHSSLLIPLPSTPAR